MQPLPENRVNVPAFLAKLWQMVNDPETDHLICWNPNGNSFTIVNQAAFWYQLLPVHYKHNNMSSFIRQLNMYGFHKISSTDNGFEGDKDELHFYHPYFRKNKPDLMRFIKRKVTGAHKTAQTVENTENQSLIKTGDMTKVLSEVKQLKGRQSDVDNQLSSLKKENTILWRELAMLRQKHHKQQQIVNKLIQFLVTIVQPSARMGGLGVKRQYPLMINECPKRARTSSETATTSDGPVIHELDETTSPYEPLLIECEQEQEALNASPTPPLLSGDAHSTTSESYWENQDLSNNADADLANVIEMMNDKPDETASEGAVSEELNDPFLNPSTQDTLLSNLMNGSYNAEALKDIKAEALSNTSAPTSSSPSPVLVNVVPASPETATVSTNTPPASVDDSMTVATTTPTQAQVSSGGAITRPKLQKLESVTNSSEDFDLHVENTQSELEQLKDLLNGCTALDANALLGLFSDDSPDYVLPADIDMAASSAPNDDPLVSGSELTAYDPNLDFSQLLDESQDEQQQQQEVVVFDKSDANADGSITTPKIVKGQPTFPAVAQSNGRSTKR